MKTIKRIIINLKKPTLTLIISILSLLIVSTPALALANTYTWRTTADNLPAPHNWLSIASSADGVKLAAVDIGNGSGGYIYTSTNSGQTWVEQTAAGSLKWASITSSADGTKLAAVDSGSGSGGYIYTSTNSGQTWTEQNTVGTHNWRSITSNTDGTKLAAVVSGGYIYTSTNSGQTWTTQATAGSRNWQSIASNTNGTKLAAVAHSDHIYTSTNSGQTWTTQATAGSRYWLSITSSADGSKLAAGVYSDHIYTSTNSGQTWTSQNTSGSHSWQSITSSADGTKLAAVDSGSGYNGNIYTSTNSGQTWTAQTTAGSREWVSITSNADGSKLAAVAYDDYIYTAYNQSLDTSIPQTITFPNVSNKAITLTTPSGTNITCSSTVTEASQPKQDSDYTYPLGLVNFCLTAPVGSTQVISLTFETNLKPNQVTARKYNPTTKQYSNVPNATITTTTINNKPALKLTYNITDGGLLDTDGIANGTILDPVGLATNSAPTNPSTLPDTGESTNVFAGIAALLTLAGSMGVLVKRYKTAKI